MCPNKKEKLVNEKVCRNGLKRGRNILQILIVFFLDILYQAGLGKPRVFKKKNSPVGFIGFFFGFYWVF